MAESPNIEDNILGPVFAKPSMGSSGERRTVSVRVPSDTAQAAANFTTPFFIAESAYEVVDVKERHEQAGNDAGAVTLMLKKVPSGTAPASGTNTLSAGINLKATADTNQSGSLSATTANKQLAVGDALSLVSTGVLTNLLGVTVTVTLRRI